MRRAHRGTVCRTAREKERGFTLVELMLGVLLFSIIAYASMSLMSSTFGVTGRMFAEFDSRKRVMVLLREMAEGASNYAGYLGASHIEFQETTVQFANGVGPERACVFRIEFPRFETESTDAVEYAWRPSEEAIYQRVGSGEWRRLLTGVTSFAVEKLGSDKHTIRVEIGHRVKGFREPIVRGAEGQARNMNVSGVVWSELIKECTP